MTSFVKECNLANTPKKGERGYDQATAKLSNLILGKEVELKNPITFTFGRLLCDVFINGKNLKDYFLEYQQCFS
jgi:endonuclease YncB( thermonuclease family)